MSLLNHSKFIKLARITLFLLNQSIVLAFKLLVRAPAGDVIA